MKWCHIFSTGTHKDSQGREHTWTNEDLEKIKFNFDSKKLNSPIAIGHIKSSSPAYGWVDELKIEDGKLYASFKDVVNEFLEAFKKGLYKNRSISLDKDLNLRHIAFLGAQAPAIKGLERFQFQENNDDIIINFENSINKGEQMDLEEQLKKSQEENTQKEEKIKELEAQIKKEQEEKLAKDFEDFCDNAIKNGNITPAMKNDVMNILQSCSNYSDFADEDSTINSFKNFVSNLKQFDFGEVAKQNIVSSKTDINFEDAASVNEAIINIQNEYKIKGIELNPIQAFNKLKEIK